MSSDDKWYFWKDNQIVETEALFSFQELDKLIPLGLLESLSVDPGHKDPPERYGYFDAKRNWKHVPLEGFPSEFRTALLLLGVS